MIQRILFAQQGTPFPINRKLILLYTRGFTEAWPDSEFVQAVLAQLPVPTWTPCAD